MDTIQLHRAVQKNNSEKVEMFLKNGADVNAKDDMGNALLHIAVSFDAHEVAEILLNNGADIEARNDLEQPPYTARHWPIPLG